MSTNIDIGAELDVEIDDSLQKGVVICWGCSQKKCGGFWISGNELPLNFDAFLGYFNMNGLIWGF